VLALAQLLAMAACAATGAAPPVAAALEASGGRIQPAPAGQFETWAYATIANTGGADALVGVSSPDAASVVLRATTLTDAGRKARSVASIPVPAHAVTRLAADTYFLAFIQAKHAFVPGQHVSATLRFASGAQRVLDLLVSDAEGDPADAGQ
jgi:copper(I)-binding protein